MKEDLSTFLGHEQISRDECNSFVLQLGFFSACSKFMKKKRKEKLIRKLTSFPSTLIIQKIE